MPKTLAPILLPMLHRIRRRLKSDMKTLRWVFLALYLLLVASPILLQLAKGRVEEFMFVLLAVHFLGQAIFILGSGTINLCQPISKRRLWLPVFLASLMLALLVLGLAISALELFKLDNKISSSTPLTLLFWSAIAASWFFWGLLLWSYATRRSRHHFLSRTTALLFAGSLAELLAAVPSHIIVSRRPGCLVGLLTMLGIVAGVYVMIFSFGPAILLLFLRPRYRREQLEAAVHPTCPNCDYDLTGTLAANRFSCPECGTKIRTASF